MLLTSHGQADITATQSTCTAHITHPQPRQGVRAAHVKRVHAAGCGAQEAVSRPDASRRPAAGQAHLCAEHAVVAGLLLGVRRRVDEAGLVGLVRHVLPQVERLRRVVVEAVVVRQLQPQLRQGVVQVVSAAVVLLGGLLRCGSASPWHGACTPC